MSRQAIVVDVRERAGIVEEGRVVEGIAGVRPSERSNQGPVGARPPHAKGVVVNGS